MTIESDVPNVDDGKTTVLNSYCAIVLLQNEPSLPQGASRLGATDLQHRDEWRLKTLGIFGSVQRMDSFDFQPTLRGHLVELRPLEGTDRDALHDASSDPLIWQQLPRVERHRRAVFDAFFEESLGLKTSLVVVERASSEVLGSSRFARFDPHKSEIEIGWTFLRRRCWGKGFNREVKELMLQHAFEFVDSVFFVAAKTNLRSRRAIEKLGARSEQQLQWPPNAEIQDASMMYRLHRKDWNRRPAVQPSRDIP